MLLHDLSWIPISVQSNLPGFWDTLIETERQQREELWKLTFLNKSITDYAIYAMY